MTRAYVIYGQGGYLTSGGMAALAQKIAAAGAVVTTHRWIDWQQVRNEINGQTGKVAIVGYSLGANAATWIVSGVIGMSGIKRRADLVILYDPTARSYVSPIGKNVGKALFYHGRVSFLWGGALVPGAERIDTWTPHEFLDWRFHDQTVASIRALRG
jgi:hypothetical protein